MADVIRVLLVEDNADDARLIARMLGRAAPERLVAPGVYPSVALTHVERLGAAVERLNGQTGAAGFDLVLLDLSLPDGRGLETLARVRAAAPRTPVVVLSGLDDEGVAVEAVRQGAQDYLVKGRVDGSLLLRSLAHAVERQRTQEALRRARDELELRVAERTAELRAANEQLAAELARRSRAESELRAAHETLRAIVQASPLAVVALDLHGNVTLWSSSAERLFGWSEAEVLGRPLPIVPAEGQPEFRTIHERALGGQGVHGRDVVRRRRDGSLVDVRLSTAALRGAQGEPLGVVGVLADVTERKRAEERERREALRTAALAEVSRLLEEAHLERGAIAEVVARCVAETSGDGCGVYLLAADERLGLAAVHDRRPEAARLARELAATARLRVGEGLGGKVVQSGQPLLLPETTPAELRARAAPEFCAYVERFGASSLLAVPVRARGRVFGAVAAVRSEPGHPYTPEDLTFVQDLADRAGLALENARLYAEAESRLTRLQALHRIDSAITGSVDLRVVLGILLDQVTGQVAIDAASVLLLDPHMQTLEPAGARGFRGRSAARAPVRLGEGGAGRAARERRIVSAADVSASEDAELHALLTDEGFVSYFAAPLVAKGQAKGVLEVFARTPIAADWEWQSFLEALAAQAAIAVDSATLFDRLARANVQLSVAYDATIEGWSRALDLRDAQSEGHSQRVAEAAVRLARAVGVPDAEVAHIWRGALLHDLGKMGIPDAILLKPGPLSDDEWEVMRRHSTIAYEFLAPISFLRPALEIPYCHHERWDGRGYPRGLRGEQIPLAARIFAVVNVWDALLSDRPHRPAWPREKALAYIREHAGQEFDPAIAQAFLELSW